MTRRVGQLLWANRGERPDLPSGPKSGAKRAGIRYEAALSEALPVAIPAIWWHYCDTSGTGWCQTDFLLRGASRDLVLESKLTYTEDAWAQLEALYIPVVHKALARPVFGLQVCKRFLGQVSPGVLVSCDLAEAIHLSTRPDRPRVVLHWIPKLSPPLWPLRRSELKPDQLVA